MQGNLFVEFPRLHGWKVVGGLSRGGRAIHTSQQGFFLLKLAVLLIQLYLTFQCLCRSC